MRTLHFLKTLGAGSFGTVYLAEFSSDQGFRRNVAVKVILTNRPDNEMFISRIRDEARLLGLLQDDAILKVLDMVRIEGRDAVVMEYVEGADLDSVVSRGHTPPPRALAELGAAVAGALRKAHTARHPRDGTPLNVIHRDVKPANIMVTRSGGVKLLDFGVARARFESRESYTGHLMLGTLNYMAPEYIVTNEVSPAADVYGLGLSLWEIAAGQGFGQPKVRQNAHEERLSQRLAEIRGTHRQLADVLESMLLWDPEQRPTAAEAERKLMQAADQISGASLRTWAQDVIPQVLRAREPAPDNAALLDRTVELDASPRVTLQADKSELNPELHQARTQRLPVRPDKVPEPVDTKTAAPPPRPAPPPSSSPPDNASSLRDVLVVVLKGLLAGGLLGFLAVAALAIYLIFLR